MMDDRAMMLLCIQSELLVPLWSEQAAGVFAWGWLAAFIGRWRRTTYGFIVEGVAIVSPRAMSER